MDETYSKLNSTHKIVVTMLQQLVTECTGWYWLHSLVHLLQQLVIECTGWYWLHSLVHLLQQLVTECTDQVLATQPWYSLSDPNWLQSHPTQSIQPCVDSGAGRQQVSTNMASTDWLQYSNHQTRLPAIQPYFHQNRLQSLPT